MKPKKLCKLCHKRPAEVPDRDSPGRPIKAVCRECHVGRLTDDLVRVVAGSIDRLKARLESDDIVE